MVFFNSCYEEGSAAFPIAVIWIYVEIISLGAVVCFSLVTPLFLLQLLCFSFRPFYCLNELKPS